MPVSPKSALAFLRGGLFRNIASLYGVQASHQLLQLLTIPFLARVLGPAEWGRLAQAQSVALFTQLIVGYGFPIAATREVARYRGDASRIAIVVSDIFGAQGILGLLVSAGAVMFCKMWLPGLFADPRLLALAILSGLLGGTMPMWFFQGQERMGRVASLDMLGKLTTAVGLFLVIRSPQDGWKMLALQAGSAAVVFAIACREIFGLHRVPRPSATRVADAFRSGWDMFLFTGASSTLSIGNVLLLGLFVPNNVVGFYAGAEKLCRAFVGFLWPLNQAIFPRVNHLCHTNPPAGARLVLRSFAVMGGAGMAIAVAGYVLAPQVIRLVLGPGFESAVDALRLMTPMIAVMPLNIVFGLQWSVSMGLDRSYGRAILLAVLVNTVVASILAPRYGHLGMAASVTLTEFFMFCSIWFLLKKHNLSPFRVARQTSEVPTAGIPPLPATHEM